MEEKREKKEEEANDGRRGNGWKEREEVKGEGTDGRRRSGGRRD